MKTTLSFWLIILLSISAHAQIKTELVEYKQGDATLEGVLTYDSGLAGKRPAVLVVHQWTGLGDYEKKRSEMLSKLGYNVLAVDIYGKGIRPKNPSDAGALAGKYKADRGLLRSRAQAGLEVLLKHSLTDTRRVAAIGYCFGGTTALELARSGAAIAGVVSFHGALNTAEPGDAGNIKGKVLALHGADDPFVPAAEVSAFEDEMRKAKVDWQLVSYGNAVHSFTDWGAGSDNTKGAAYNERADRRSWDAMKGFFAEIFK